VTMNTESRMHLSRKPKLQFFSQTYQNQRTTRITRP